MKNKITNKGVLLLEVQLSDIPEVVDSIRKEHLSVVPFDRTLGFVKDHHITLCYGFDHEVHEGQILEVMDKFSLPELFYFSGLELFENEEHDILICRLRPSETLNALNLELSKLLKKTPTYNYNPHLTIAYLKKGKGKRYTYSNVAKRANTFIKNHLSASPLFCKLRLVDESGNTRLQKRL